MKKQLKSICRILKPRWSQSGADYLNGRMWCWKCWNGSHEMFLELMVIPLTLSHTFGSNFSTVQQSMLSQSPFHMWYAVFSPRLHIFFFFFFLSQCPDAGAQLPPILGDWTCPSDWSPQDNHDEGLDIGRLRSIWYQRRMHRWDAGIMQISAQRQTLKQRCAIWYLISSNQCSLISIGPAMFPCCGALKILWTLYEGRNLFERPV